MERTFPPEASVRATAVAAAAAGRPLRGLAPVAVAATVVDGCDNASAAPLLTAPVEVALTVAPALDETLVQLGAVRGRSGVYRVPAGSRAAAPVAAVHPGCLRVNDGKRLRAITTTEQLSELLGCSEDDLLTAGIQLPARRPRGAAGAVVEVSRTGSKVTVRIDSSTVAVADLSLPSGIDGRRPARLPLEPALAVLDAVAGAGVIVFDASDGGLRRLRRLAATAVVVADVAGAPGMASVAVDAARTTVDVAEALRIVAAHHLDRHVAVHPSVADVAGIAAASPWDDELLRPWQQQFVGAYLAARRGLVNALAPGAGKTVCTLAAFRQSAATSPGPWQALVCVPASLREQWVAEAAIFFPEAHVVRLTSAADATSLPDLHPLLVVASHDVAGRAAGVLSARTWNELACDEAVVVRGSSARAQALWQLRAAARRATALTGTPAEGNVDGLAPIVAWAMGSPAMFDGAPLSGDGPSWQERVGPTVFSAEVAAELPDRDHQIVVLTPNDRELALLAAARAEAAEADAELAKAEAGVGGKPGPARMRVLAAATASRMAASGPVAFTGAKGRAAEAWRAAGLCAGRSTKLTWLPGALPEGPTLIFSDFTAVAEAAVDAVDATGRKVALISGSLNSRQRDRIVAAFDAGELDVLVLTAAAKLGLNLQRADAVIHLDVPASRSDLLQREARAARIGRTGPVSVIVPVLAGSVEVDVADTLVGLGQADDLAGLLAAA